MNAPPSPFSKLSLIQTGPWLKMIVVKQSLWTLREARTKEGRWNNRRPFDLRARKDDSSPPWGSLAQGATSRYESRLQQVVAYNALK